MVSGAVTSDMIGNDKVVPTVEGSIHRVNVYLKSDYYDVSFPRLIVFLADQHIPPGFCDCERKAFEEVRHPGQQRRDPHDHRGHLPVHP